MSLDALCKQLKKNSSKEKAKILQTFFKTGPGQYAEGDIFLGIKVADIRKLARQYQRLGLSDVARLFKSAIHEERLLALLMLVLRYSKANEDGKKGIYELYLKHTGYVNSWDLVDLSAGHIVGAFLMHKAKQPLYLLAKSGLLWERRISIVATFHFIKNDKFDSTLRIAAMLIADKEDLIHKAVGWMLREVGKRNRAIEERFLGSRYKLMPRTMLRYAIERFPEARRQAYLKGKV